MRLSRIILCIIGYIVLDNFQAVVWGQTISGKITDDSQQPVDGATIVLQTMDSIYVGASISNADGTFLLNSQPEEYRLIIQHLLYQTKQITARERVWGSFSFSPKIML